LERKLMQLGLILMLMALLSNFEFYERPSWEFPPSPERRNWLTPPVKERVNVAAPFGGDPQL
jgi:hypothetical protein